MGNNNNNKEKPNFNSLRPGNKAPKVNPYWIYGIIIIAFLAIQWFTLGGGPVETNWKDVKTNMIANNDIKKIIVVNEKEAQIFLKETSYDKYLDKLNKGFTTPTKTGPHFFFTIGSVDSFEKNLQETQASLTEENKISVEYKTVHNYLGELLNWILPFAIIILIWWWIFKRMSKGSGGGGAGNIFNVGKSQAKVFDKDSRVSTNFKDVAGLAEAKQEVEEIVDFLKSPTKFTKLGGKIPKGALLVGPPGTGKTLLAKAVAGEANVPFFSMSGSDFVEMFVGVGASRVRDLFKQAKEKSPCIVFIDEIDAIGRARGKNPNMGSND